MTESAKNIGWGTRSSHDLIKKRPKHDQVTRTRDAPVWRLGIARADDRFPKIGIIPDRFIKLFRFRRLLRETRFPPRATFPTFMSA
jgi:hypothetical protein